MNWIDSGQVKTKEEVGYKESTQIKVEQSQKNYALPSSDLSS